MNAANIPTHKPTTDMRHPVQKFRQLTATLKHAINLRDQKIATIARLQRELQQEADIIRGVRVAIGELVPALDGYVQCQKQAQFISRQA